MGFITTLKKELEDIDPLMDKLSRRIRTIGGQLSTASRTVGAGGFSRVGAAPSADGSSSAQQRAVGGDSRAS